MHEPARFVGSDRHHHEVEWAAVRADVGELRMIRGVPCKIDVAGAALERVTAPERLVPVAHPPCAEVSRGCAGDTSSLHVHRVPPIQLHDGASAPAAKVCAQAKRCYPGRVGMRASDSFYRRLIEMIVI